MKGKRQAEEREAPCCKSCQRKYTRKNPQVDQSNRCKECTAVLLRAYGNWESLKHQGRLKMPLELHRERAIEILQTIASFEAPLPTRLYDFKSLS